MTATSPSIEIDFLRQIPLFADLPEDDLQTIAGRLKRRRFKKGEVIYHQEDLPGSLYLTVSGILKLRLQSPSGKQFTLSTIRPGNFFGTISLLDGQERLADAIALTPSELMVLGRDDFQSFLEQHPRETLLLLEITASRWRNTMRRVADLAFLDVPGRLARVLLGIEIPPESVDQARTGLEITQPELAALTGTTRETVSRWLKTFADAGLIDYRRGRYTVLDREGLHTYVKG